MLEGTERDIVAATAKLALALGYFQAGGPHEQYRDALAELKAALARFEAPRILVCRKHMKQFSSSTPCPGCGDVRPQAFLLDAVGLVHVVLTNGSAACARTVVGRRMSKLDGAATCCQGCHEVVPGGVWNAELAG